MIAEFTLALRGYESHPETIGDFLQLAARVDCRGFSGETWFQMSRRDLDRFVSEASALHAGAPEAVNFVGGWDDREERMRVRLARAGISGGFAARVRIANTGPRTDQWHHVETDFVCPAPALARFLAELQRLVESRIAGTATLSGDAEAIA